MVGSWTDGGSTVTPDEYQLLPWGGGSLRPPAPPPPSKQLGVAAPTQGRTDRQEGSEWAATPGQNQPTNTNTTHHKEFGLGGRVQGTRVHSGLTRWPSSPPPQTNAPPEHHSKHCTTRAHPGGSQHPGPQTPEPRNDAGGAHSVRAIGWSDGGCRGAPRASNGPPGADTVQGGREVQTGMDGKGRPPPALICDGTKAVWTKK